ncbi:LAMI_0F15676g1_1 [Lachancea mirantina]|uniref:LAMI_0F15676g1_1 n=1 Tax=Lachancea mirantina TaxID=1230905 RepID=A0A1G4K4N5_9SACH|nr:LAMI_0F15676g1_1 [Lachancea mirantina]
MTRVTRNWRDESEDDLGSSNTQEIKDENGIVHTTSRSLRKVNYAEDSNSDENKEDEAYGQGNYAGAQAVDDDGDEDEDVSAFRRHSNRTRQNATFYSENEDHDPHTVDWATANATVVNQEPAQQEENFETDQYETSQGSHARANNKSLNQDEDESFHEDDVQDLDDDMPESEDEYLSDDSVRRHQRRADQNFIVNDEGDQDTDEDDKPLLHRNFRNSTLRARRSRPRDRSPPRKLRRRTRSTYHSDEEGYGNEPLSLADELKELRDDSPIREKRSLRERTKPVNYTLPPPLPDHSASGAFGAGESTSFEKQSPRGRRGLHVGQSFGPIRRLFPTGGPFGGNDVTAIFGTNTNFYGANVTSKNSKLLIDSDSSEDEILPIGKSSTEKKPGSGTEKKKKPEIADLDPLGVDMNIKFEDVGGLDNYIDQLKEMVALPLLYPELYQNFGITPPRGVLFHGPPGTGKTLMARALAASCSSDGQKITFFMRKGADILSKWVGEAERQLRLLFDEAKKNQPSIIFFDEIDGLAPVRSSKQEQIHASIVSTMLALMDGMDNRGQVIVIGATNRPDAVDPALRRPGRFDREFYFPLPDLEARSKILEIHTKKWEPPLSKILLEKLASMTKGYGGADLRALCTEAALISIQRRFPQIYQSNEKLAINPSDVKVKARDFMLALDKITPSSARSTSSLARPLPEGISILLNEQLEEIKDYLKKIMPSDSTKLKQGQSIIKHFLNYCDDSDEDDSAELAKTEFIKAQEKARTYRPRLLVGGASGSGQQYIGPAILHHLEHFNVQKLDLGNLMSDSTRTVESAITQIFIEARRRQPSILYIPDTELWLRCLPEGAILTFASLCRSLKSSEQVLVLAIANGLDKNDIAESSISEIGFNSSFMRIREPASHQRRAFFQNIAKVLSMPPVNFQSSRKRKNPLPVLPKAPPSLKGCGLDQEGKPLSAEAKLSMELKSFQTQDMKTKNALKIKLSGLMDLFKNRYKRFRKPPIEDALLIHLFEQNASPENNIEVQPAYVKDGEMILEVATGRKFYNMDLDIVEERLWNGFYSEPKQYLKDIELIYHDAHTSGDRERIIKASEMFANAQMGIEELSQPDFIKECKAVRQRELLRQKLFLEQQSKEAAADTGDRNPVDSAIGEPEIVAEQGPQEEVGVGAGNQLQAQLQSDAYPTETIGSDAVLNSNDGNESAPGEAHVKAQDDSMMKSVGEQEDEVPIVLNGIPQDSSSGKLVEESSTASTPDEDHYLQIDTQRMEDLVNQLENWSNGYTVEQLEDFYAIVLNIVWEDRFSWDRNSTIDKILDYLSS